MHIHDRRGQLENRYSSFGIGVSPQTEEFVFANIGEIIVNRVNY